MERVPLCVFSCQQELTIPTNLTPPLGPDADQQDADMFDDDADLIDDEDLFEDDVIDDLPMVDTSASLLTALEMVELITQSIDDDKGEEIVVIDLEGKTSIADYMVIASGRSSRQVGAIGDHIIEKLKKQGVLAVAEGKTTCDWVLVDAGDVLVHLFRPEVRAFYNLEKMWGGTSAPPAGTAMPHPPAGAGFANDDQARDDQADDDQDEEEAWDE